MDILCKNLVERLLTDENMSDSRLEHLTAQLAADDSLFDGIMKHLLDSNTVARMDPDSRTALQKRLQEVFYCREKKRSQGMNPLISAGTTPSSTQRVDYQWGLQPATLGHGVCHGIYEGPVSGVATARGKASAPHQHHGAAATSYIDTSAVDPLSQRASAASLTTFLSGYEPFGLESFDAVPHASCAVCHMNASSCSTVPPLRTREELVAAAAEDAVRSAVEAARLAGIKSPQAYAQAYWDKRLHRGEAEQKQEAAKRSPRLLQRGMIANTAVGPFSSAEAEAATTRGATRHVQIYLNDGRSGDVAAFQSYVAPAHAASHSGSMKEASRGTSLALSTMPRSSSSPGRPPRHRNKATATAAANGVTAFDSPSPFITASNPRTAAGAGAAPAVEAPAQLRLADLSAWQRWSEGDTKGAGASVGGLVDSERFNVAAARGYPWNPNREKFLRNNAKCHRGGSHRGTHCEGGEGEGTPSIPRVMTRTEAAASLKAVRDHHGKAVAHRHAPYTPYALLSKEREVGVVRDKGESSISGVVTASEGGSHSHGGSEGLPCRSATLSSGDRTVLVHAMHTLELRGQRQGSSRNSTGGFITAGRGVAASNQNLPVTLPKDATSVQGGSGKCQLRLFGSTVSVLPPPSSPATICHSPVAVTISESS